MGPSDPKSLQSLGFLTALEDEQQGWLGGLLVLNSASRPLEFHCTAPVKPSRAQEILYGNTLVPYICGEQIGAALAKKSNFQPAVYFTNVVDMMAVRRLVDSPVVYVDCTPAESKSLRIDSPHGTVPAPHLGEFIKFTANDLAMCVDKNFPGDESSAIRLLDSALAIDLHEPFERVHEALQETQLRKR